MVEIYGIVDATSK